MEPPRQDGFFGRLFDALPVPAVVFELDSGVLLYANSAFLRLLDFEAQELVGQRPPYPFAESFFKPGGAKARRAASTAPVATSFRRRDGTLVPVALVGSLVPGAAGELPAEVLLVSDLTERRSLEWKLVASGQAAAVGQLAAGAAHEINNPLFAILGLVDFLLLDAEPGTKTYDRLLVIRETALEIREIVRTLVDFARERPDEIRTVSLVEVARQTVELARRTSLAKAVEIVERYPLEELLLEGSPAQLKQLFLALLRNAEQAMPEGGTVTLKLARNGEWALATVSDTGPGIPAGILPHIFEPFFTTRADRGASGLGLAVGRDIALLHGGELTARSREGEGASFALRVPLQAAERA